MKGWGMGFGEHSHGQGQTHGFGSNTSETSEVAELKAQVASMEKTIDAMNQRLIVLEKLIVDDEARISREIDRLRDKSVSEEETMREIARLKERVAVLEKLVTDDDRRLAGDIDRLRGDDLRR